MALIAFLTSCEEAGPLALDSPSAFPLQGMEVDPRVSVAFEVTRDADELVVIVHAENPTTETLSLTYGYCSFRLRAYRDANLIEPAYWDDQEASLTGCPEIQLLERLAPGASEFELGSRREADLALGLPAPPGVFGVVVILNRERLVLPGGLVS